MNALSACQPAFAVHDTASYCRVAQGVQRILHVFSRMARGGAEMRTLDIMRRIDRRRYQLEFCILSGQPGDLDEEIRALGGKVHPCPLGPTFPWRFTRLLRQHGFHAVHSHLHMSSGFVLRLAHQCVTPLRIAHFRNTSAGHPMTVRYRLQDQLLRHWIDRHATHILGVGEGALAQGWSPAWQEDSRCAVIHNGLDVTPFEIPPDPRAVRREFGWPETCRVLIHVGRMAPQKNHLRTAEIAGLMMRQDPTVRLLMVGREDAATKTRLLEFLRTEGLLDRVALTGTRNDVPRLLQAADAMLFPSLWEGLPGAVLEACAAGLPVLASDLPGVVEIATRFSTVHCLPLQAANTCWATTAQHLLAPPADDAARTAARQAFAQSVYGIERCVAAHCRVWSGTPAADIRRMYG